MQMTMPDGTIFSGTPKEIAEVRNHLTPVEQAKLASQVFTPPTKKAKRNKILAHREERTKNLAVEHVNKVKKPINASDVAQAIWPEIQKLDSEVFQKEGRHLYEDMSYRTHVNRTNKGLSQAHLAPKSLLNRSLDSTVPGKKGKYLYSPL